MNTKETEPKILTFNQEKKLMLEQMEKNASNCEIYDNLMEIIKVDLLSSPDENKNTPHTIQDVFEVGNQLRKIHLPNCPLDISKRMLDLIQ